MFDYWIISVPPDPTCEDTWKKVLNALHKYKECACFKFYIPNLKVGTLDQLLAMSDDLARLETSVEGLVARVATQLDELLENKRDVLMENIHADNVTIHHYLITFKWDMAKYPTRQSIKTICYLIDKQISNCDAELAAKTRQYNLVITAYNACEKKRTGNLTTKFLGDYVSKDDFILDSEFLTTLVVVVPQGLKEDWLAKYERLHNEVVPRSTKQITEDNDHALFTVVLFKRAQESFNVTAKENGFIVRNFVYNEQEIFEFRREIYDLYQEKQKLYQPLVRWCKANFSETFIAMVHIKASKLYVESVLRFGLPANFQPILLVFPRKLAGKIKHILVELFSHIDATVSSKSDKKRQLEDNVYLEAEYNPYVFSKIKAEIVDIIATAK